MRVVTCNAPAVDHLCGGCSDYFVVKGCEERGTSGMTATALGTVTSRNPIARNCGSLYKVPLTLPARLWEASPTNPINYCMDAVNAMPDQRALSNILWAPSLGTLPDLLSLLVFTLRAVRDATKSHSARPAPLWKTVASKHRPLWARKMFGQPDVPIPDWLCGRPHV